MAFKDIDLTEYIYSGNAYYDIEVYVEGTKREINVINLTVSGSDASVYVPIGNLFTRYINITIEHNLLNEGEQVFLRLIPKKIGTPIDIGAFYVQGEPSVSGTSYTYTAHDKLLYADIPIDFLEQSEPDISEDPLEEYDIEQATSVFYAFVEAVKQLGMVQNVPLTDTLWKSAMDSGIMIPVKRYVKRMMLNDGNRFMCQNTYVINDLKQITVSALFSFVAMITGTNIRVEATLQDGKVVEELQAVKAFSESITDEFDQPLNLSEDDVVYAENEITRKITYILGSVTTRCKKYSCTAEASGEDLENRSLNYSEEEISDVYAKEGASGSMEVELPFTFAADEAGGHNSAQAAFNLIHAAVDYARSIENVYYKYSIEMVGDPRIRAGYTVSLAGGYKYYVGQLTQTFDGGLKMDISSGSSDNSSVSMGRSAIASIVEKTKNIEMNLNNTANNMMSVEEVNARIASFGYLKTKELAAEVAKIDVLEADSAFVTYLKTEVLDADTIKAAVADIDILTAQEADLKYASISNLEALKGSFNALNAKAVTTDSLSAENAKLGYLTASQMDVKYASVSKLEALEGSFSALNAKAVTTDNLSAENAKLGYLTTSQMDVKYAQVDSLKAKYAQIDLANVTTATIGTVLASAGLITSATIENGHVTGYLDSVSINANSIKAGTLSVDRLVINGTTGSIIYALNNAGALTSTNTNTLDGGLLTKRTITADHLVAGTITANEINMTNLVGSSAFVNAITTNSVVVTASSNASSALTKANSAASTASSAATKADSASSTASSALSKANSAASAASSAATTANYVGSNNVSYVDLSNSKYNANTYYPAVFSTAIPRDGGMHHYKCFVELDSGTKPSWSTHGSGFSVYVDAVYYNNGWGSNELKQYVENYSYSWCSKLPVYPAGMITYSSKVVMFFRGGGKYKMFTPDSGSWTVYTAKADAYGSSSYPWYVTPIADPATLTSPVSGSNQSAVLKLSKGGESVSEWTTAGTTTINGGCITTGSITADKINVTDLFSKNIVATGTITSPILKSAEYKETSSGWITGGMIVDLKNKVIKISNSAGSTGTIINSDGVNSWVGDFNELFTNYKGNSNSIGPGIVAVSRSNTYQVSIDPTLSNNMMSLYRDGTKNGYIVTSPTSNVLTFDKKLKLNTSGSIESGNEYAITGGDAYFYLNNILPYIGKCKNLMNPTVQSATQNGITVTSNGDGTYTVNGTNTASSVTYIQLGTVYVPTSGTHVVLGTNKTTVGVYINGNTPTAYNTTVTVLQSGVGKNVGFGIAVQAKATVSKAIVKPMLTRNVLATYNDFVPYTGEGETLAADVARINNNLYIKKLGTETTTVTAIQFDGRPRQYRYNFSKKYPTISFVLIRPYINNDWMLCTVLAWDSTYVNYAIANYFSSALSGTIAFDIYGY